MVSKNKIKIFAPAKINLYLHILDKLPNNYHILDSLAAFVDIGDLIEIEESNKFSFEIKGKFAHEFSEKDKLTNKDSTNLIIRAINLISQKTNNTPDFKITLTKNLPLASGIGGGSSNAASTIWGLMEWWNISPQAPYLKSLMLELGTDVPVCLSCRPSRMLGIGDIIQDIPTMPECPIILVNNGDKCPTQDIYNNFNKDFKKPIDIPSTLNELEKLTDFLSLQSNDLTSAAIQYKPKITDVIKTIKEQENCLLSRMSGSGSTCFGIFLNTHDAKKAANNISKTHPNWWIKSGFLNRPARY